MAKGKQAGPSLFDAIEIEEDSEAEECPHRHEIKTDTYWPGYGWRWTWTCVACGEIRGRATNK